MTARDVFGIVGTTQVGNFHVERVVAEGGFGVVYRAQHGAFRAPVALKCLKIPEEMTKQARSIFLEKFREEAELMFRLSAAIAEVVRPLHVDVLHLSDGRFVPFIALEWLEGESLDGIITRRRTGGQAPLGLHKVVKMLRPVAGALSKAHHFPAPQGAVSIIHRDLKPENIFVANIGGNETMKILDYGIAKAKRAASQAVGRVTGQRIAEDETASFTPAYGAPEQWTPKTYGETGPWTDVWGLALCMVEALTGTPPIDGDTFVMRRACLDDKRRPTPRTCGADVPVQVDRVFEQALAVDPRKRFKEIDAFWTELEGAMGLPPSFGRRDERREPGESTKEASLKDSSMRLAKIDLAKMAAPPPSRPGPGGNEGAPSRRMPDAAPASAPASSSKAPQRKDAVQMVAVQEDWSSLGMADELPSSSARAAQPSSPVQTPRGMAQASPGGPPQRFVAEPVSAIIPTPEALSGPAPAVRQAVQGGAASGPRAPAEPYSRKLSAGFEFDLPTAGDAPAPAIAMAPYPAPAIRYPSSADLEMNLPVHDGAGDPPPAAAAPVPPAAPMYAAPAPPPSAPASPPAASPRADDFGPRSSPSGELELLLPASVQEAAPEPSSSAGWTASKPTPSVRSPSSEPSPPGLDFDLAGPALKVAAAPLPPVSTPAMSAPASPRREMEERRAPEHPHAPAVSAGQRLLAPLGILLAALLVAVADIVFFKVTEEHLMLGPVRPFWIAAPLALFGVGLTLWRLVGVQRDDEP